MAETQAIDFGTPVVPGTEWEDAPQPVVPPVVPPVIPNVTNLCSGVVCDDVCTASYDSQSGGVCVPETGKCSYAKVETLSAKCLPVPVNNTAPVATTPATGPEVGAEPDRDSTLEEGATPTGE